MMVCSQYDLARDLGLHRSTVNRILNGHTSMGGSPYSPDTIAKVLAAAEAAGYVRPGSTGRPTQAEIGRQLGLSRVAVGVALRPPSKDARTKVSDATRARVRAKAEELGYVHPSGTP